MCPCNVYVYIYLHRSVHRYISVSVSVCVCVLWKRGAPPVTEGPWSHWGWLKQHFVGVMCPKSPWPSSRHPNPLWLFPALCASAASYPAPAEDGAGPAFSQQFNWVTVAVSSHSHQRTSAGRRPPQRGKHWRNHRACRVFWLLHWLRPGPPRVLAKDKRWKDCIKSAPMMILWMVTTLT